MYSRQEGLKNSGRNSLSVFPVVANLIDLFVYLGLHQSPARMAVQREAPTENVISRDLQTSPFHGARTYVSSWSTNSLWLWDTKPIQHSFCLHNVFLMPILMLFSHQCERLPATVFRVSRLKLPNAAERLARFFLVPEVPSSHLKPETGYRAQDSPTFPHSFLEIFGIASWSRPWLLLSLFLIRYLLVVISFHSM
jgi:hypothetical protein